MRRAAANLRAITLAVGIAAIAQPLRAGGTDGVYAPPPGIDLSWRGFYVGGNLGGSFDGSNLSIHDLSAAQDLTLKDSSDDGVLGGVHVGYNLHGAHILYGVEGDADFGETVNFLGSLRARVGWIAGRWLIYGTGGVAFLDADQTFTVASASNGSFTSSYGESSVGFGGGGGIEFKLASKVSVGADALFYSFANDEAHLTAGNEPFVLHDHADLSEVRGRLTYYFNTGY